MAKKEDLFDLIQKDHEKVRQVMKKIQKSRPGMSRESDLDRLKVELLPHMMLEEQMFYPIMIDESEQRELGFEAIEEHRVARNVLDDLEELEPSDEKWSARFKVFMELVEHHIEEEESDVFEAAREIIDSDRAMELGKQFQSQKRKILKSAA